MSKNIITLASYPLLLKEWDQEKNRELIVEEIRHGSHRIVWWLCSVCDYSWDAMVKSRARLGRGCPPCAGVKINSLDIDCPELVKFWDYEKNEKLPNEYTAGMHKKVWWICEREHSWKNNIFYMVRREGKGYCLDCRLIDNDRYMSKESYPELYKEYDKVKNAETSFDKCTKGSNIKRWWICKKQHSYDSTVPDRLRGRGCSTCAGLKKISLVEEYPHIAKDWNDEKDISKFTSGSDYVAQWKCSKNKQHKYSEPIKRHVKNNNCAVCVKRIFKPFYSENIDLLLEWDYEKNKDVKPESFSAGSHKVVWWLCAVCEYSWENPVYAYVRGTRCIKCRAREKSSKGEKELANFVESICSEFNVVKNDFSLIKPYELDVYIPELKIAFEYNGDYWHSEAVIQERSGVSADEYHKRKVDLCANADVKLFYVWEKNWIKNNKESKSIIANIIKESVTSHLATITKRYEKK